MQEDWGNEAGEQQGTLVPTCCTRGTSYSKPSLRYPHMPTLPKPETLITTDLLLTQQPVTHPCRCGSPPGT